MTGVLQTDMLHQDMELLEILYMQDIDLGVDRDLFSFGYHIEDELDALKRKAEQQIILPEEKSTQLMVESTVEENDEPLTNTFPQLNLSGRYVIDTETGELILVQSPEPTNAEQYSSELSVQPPVATSEQTLELLLNTLSTQDSTSMSPDSTALLPDNSSSYVIESGLLDAGPMLLYNSQLAPVAYERQSSVDQRWADVISVINEYSGMGGDTAWEALKDLDTGATFELPTNVNIETPAPAPVHKNSLLVSLLTDSNFPPQQHVATSPQFSAHDNFRHGNINTDSRPRSSAVPTHSNMTAHLPVENGFSSTLFNATNVLVHNTPADIAMTDFLGFTDTDSHRVPNLTILNQQTSGGFGPMAFMENVAGNISTVSDSDITTAAVSMAMDVDQLTVSIPDQTVAAANPNELLQDLLYSDLLADNIDLENVMDDGDIICYQTNGAWSTDSAVSSMNSPGQLSLGGSSPSSVHTDTAAELTSDGSSAHNGVLNWDNSASPFSFLHHPQQANKSTNLVEKYHKKAATVTTVKTVRHSCATSGAARQRSRAQAEEDAEREREDREDRAARSRDEKRAKAMMITLTMEEIIDSSVEHFTHLLSRHNLNDAQLQLVRDIRRRGKNKLAAQNCRKRKMEVIQTVEEQVMSLREERDQLHEERISLDRGVASLRHKLAQLERDLFHRLHDESGREYDPSAYSLQQTDNGGFFIVPKDNSVPTTDSVAEKSHNEKQGRKRKPKKKD